MSPPSPGLRAARLAPRSAVPAEGRCYRHWALSGGTVGPAREPRAGQGQPRCQLGQLATWILGPRLLGSVDWFSASPPCWFSASESGIQCSIQSLLCPTLLLIPEREASSLDPGSPLSHVQCPLFPAFY